MSGKWEGKIVTHVTDPPSIFGKADTENTISEDGKTFTIETTTKYRGQKIMTKGTFSKLQEDGTFTVTIILPRLDPQKHQGRILKNLNGYKITGFNPVRQSDFTSTTVLDGNRIGFVLILANEEGIYEIAEQGSLTRITD